MKKNELDWMVWGEVSKVRWILDVERRIVELKD